MKLLQYQLAIKLARSLCAIEIQRIWRGCGGRKYMNNDSSTRLILKWKWGRQENDVYIAGDFSSWQKWKMTWMPCFRDHRLLVPVPFMKQCKESFEFKFIVDGLWTCDGTLPMKESFDNSVNNIYAIPKRSSGQDLRLLSFGKSKTSFPRLPSMNSLRYSSRKSETKLHISHSSNEVAPSLSVGQLSKKPLTIRGI